MAIKSEKNKINSSENDDLLQKRSLDLENGLRPSLLNEYVGQEGIKRNLEVLINAAKIRKSTLDHILLHGPPGLGKTTLANIIAAEMGSQLRITSGPALEKPGDIASILTNLKEGSILFIDEIHSLRPLVEELLYTAMEDFKIDLMIGKGPAAKIMRLSLPKFTLLGATTKISKISSPLRDRFGSVFKLDFYTIEEISTIINRSAGVLHAKIEKDAALKLAACSRRTPRIANRLLKRVIDLALVNNTDIVDDLVVQGCLKSMEIDELGLDRHDRQILQTIANKFNGGPVGLNTLAYVISEDEATIEDFYEPYLMQLGMLERTARGRMLTKSAYKHIKSELK